MKRREKYAYIALSVVGIAIAVYLTIYHYAAVPIICPSNNVFSCITVLNSAYSNLFGLPIALYGVLFFAIEITLVFVSGYKARLAWNLLGIAFVIYLLYAEYMIGRICIYCTTVHITVVALFVLSLYEALRK